MVIAGGFENALARLKEGCAVRRATSPDYVIRLVDGGLAAFYDGFRIDTVHELDVRDIFADDWEVVE